MWVQTSTRTPLMDTWLHEIHLPFPLQLEWCLARVQRGGKWTWTRKLMPLTTSLMLASFEMMAITHLLSFADRESYGHAQSFALSFPELSKPREFSTPPTTPVTR